MTSFSSSYSQSGLPGISAIAEQLMQAQYAWGQQQFAQTSQLTNQVVGDMMNLYGSLSGMGTTLMNQYSQYFMPEYQNLVNDANNYSSQARIQQAMGAAESGVAQNFNGQRNAALADLQSFGIDPSSGRYAQLDQAQRTQEAAAAAGAGFQAEQATEATGRALRSEALQLGSVMPSQATAAYNAAQGAATAGENAKLANSQEGVNMMGSPTQWGALAQQLRTAASSSGPGSGGGGQRPPDSISGSNAGHPTPAFSPPSAPNYGPMGTGGQGQGGGGGGGGPGVGPGSHIMGGPGDQGSSGQFGPQGQADWGPSTAGQAGSNYQGPTTDWANAPMGPDTAGQAGSSYYGPATDSANPQMGPDTAGQAGSSYYGPATDSANPQMGPDTAGQAGSSYYGPPTDSSNPVQDQTGVDTSSSNIDASAPSSSYNTGSYAKGGEITNYSGAIPYSRSPSHGKTTDDVHGILNQTGEPLRLNAGEFVIPRHTVAWKGEEYFQNLIEKSKKARAGAGAKPTMKPALRQGAIPSSHHMAGAHHG